MKKIIQRVLMFTIPLFVLFHISITSFAISDEEKELFDLLGVQYNVNADGTFETFQVDMDTPKISVDAKRAFIEKYQNGSKIGNFYVCVSQEEDAEDAVILISSNKENVSLYISDTVIEYKNPSTEYTRFEYGNEGADKPLYIKMLKENPDNHNRPLGDSYCLNHTGDYVLRYRSDAENDYRYDEDGNLIERYELATNVIYDENDIVSKKLVYSSDDGAIFVSAKYAEEIQKTSNEEKMNYSALSEYIERYEEAQQFGMEVSDYIERYEKLQAYEEAVQRPAYLDEKAKIFGVNDKSVLWNQPENLTEEDYAALEANWNISEREIAEEVARLINEYRVENGVEELDFSDSLLQQVADIRAVELTYVMDKAHSRPWLGNTSTFAIGENAASAPVIYKDMMIEYSSESIARTLFEGWKNSPGHNANMLEATYAEGSVGIKFSYVNGNLIVYAGTPFYYGDYENTVSELVRNRIALGAQTNYSHAGEYNSELSNLIHGYTTREDVAQKTDDDTINYIDEGLASEESTSEGTVIVKDGIKYNYNLKVLDTSGNKFQLPNGVDWVRADSQLWWHEGLYSADGQGHDLYKGDIYFSAEDGNRYMLNIYPAVRDMDTLYDSTGYWTNNFVGDTIIIAPCDDGFTTIEQFGLSFESLYCTKQCYYITNGELIILDYEGNVTE